MSQADNDKTVLIPKLPRGNPEREALASQDGKLELPEPNYLAGAWEPEKIPLNPPISKGEGYFHMVSANKPTIPPFEKGGLGGISQIPAPATEKMEAGR